MPTVVMRNANGNPDYAGAGISFAQSGSPTGAPTAPATSATTGATPKVGRYPDSTGTIDLVKQAQPEDPSTIAARISDSYASEIAAIKANAADQLTKQATINANNEGKARATSSATGTLGGPMGNRSQALSEEQSQQANQDITDTEEGKISTIDAAAASAAEGEYTTEKAGYTTALQNKIASTQSMIQSVAATTPIDELSQSEYDSLYASAGFDSPEEFNAYYSASANAAKLGTKLVGDADTGYYMPQIDPATGKVSYSNVIKPKPVAGSQYGTYQFDPVSGQVTSVSPGSTSKVITSGGRLWLVPMKDGSPTGGAATPLTPAKATGSGTKEGWDRATIDQQLAVQGEIEREAAAAGKDPQTYLQQVQGNSEAFLTVLNSALQHGSYSPISLSASADDGAAAADAETAAQNAQDAADNSGTDSNGS